MPYVITRRRPVDAVDAGHPSAPARGWPVTGTVANTLDGARCAADGLLADYYAEHFTGPDEREFSRQAYAIPESGGTVGPLPDGTIIEVVREP